MGEECMLKNNLKVLVYAGPNGSGKSTAYKNRGIIGRYINADDIKKERACSDIVAAIEAEQQREFCLENKENFTFETVLSTDRNLIFLMKAKDMGYYIDSVFVLTADVELNVLRVQSRVAKGGHDVPEDKIRSRYGKSLKNLPTLIKISDACLVVDNTDKASTIFEKAEKVQYIQANDFWSEDAIKKLIN